MKFEELIGRRVKAIFTDRGEERVRVGELTEVTETYVMVGDNAIGLGKNFVTLFPIDGGRKG